MVPVHGHGKGVNAEGLPKNAGLSSKKIEPGSTSVIVCKRTFLVNYFVMRMVFLSFPSQLLQWKMKYFPPWQISPTNTAPCIALLQFQSSSLGDSR